MHFVSESSETNVFGQTARMSSSLATSRPCLSIRNTSTRNAWRLTLTSCPLRSRQPRSRSSTISPVEYVRCVNTRGAQGVAGRTDLMLDIRSEPPMSVLAGLFRVLSEFFPGFFRTSENPHLILPSLALAVVANTLVFRARRQGGRHDPQ